MLDKVFSHLKPINEDNFIYYDLTGIFDVSFNTVSEGEVVQTHSHKVDVFNYIMEGEVILDIGGSKQVYKKGDWIFIQANVEHALKVRKNVVFLELWLK